MLIDALSVLCAQLTRDLLAIAKFLFYLRVATPFLIFRTKRDSNIVRETPPQRGRRMHVGKA